MTLKSRIMPDYRVKSLKELLDRGKLVRVIEAHSGMSAIIANSACIGSGDNKQEFDAIWVSSLTETASKGYPDAEILGFDSRLGTINEIAEVSNKPIIVDGDTGMDVNHFEYMVKKDICLGIDVSRQIVGLVCHCPQTGSCVNLKRTCIHGTMCLGRRASICCIAYCSPHCLAGNCYIEFILIETAVMAEFRILNNLGYAR